MSDLAKLLRVMGTHKVKPAIPCFIDNLKEGKISILIVYVDDIILTDDDHVEQERLKRVLASDFEIKYLGGLKYFLGMEFLKSKRDIFVSHRKYVLDLLSEMRLLGCKATKTPIEHNLKLQLAKPEKVKNKEQFLRLVGVCLFLYRLKPLKLT